jgi:SNF2 family DNA or RNA helicase
VKDWTPRPYQGLMFDFMVRVTRGNLFVPMGFGKTSAVLWALVAFLLAGLSLRVLVLAPLRVARSTWLDEVRKWTFFKDIRIGFIEDWLPEEKAFLSARWRLQRAVKVDETCRKPETKALMAEVDRLHPAAQAARRRWVRQFHVVTCNYDVLQQLIDILGDKWPFDTVICDESTRLKSTRTKQGSKRGRALADVAFLPRLRRWYNLTGTPAPNGLQDLWGQMYFIDQGARLGKSFSAFQDRWFGFKREADAKNPKKFYAKRILFPHSEAEINAAIADVSFTLNPKDWFDLKEPIVNHIYVDMPPAARAQYKQLEREMFTTIDGHQIIAVAAAPKMVKCLQLAAGAAYINESNEEWVNVHDEKIEALRSVVEEASGAPILVAYHLRSDLARLLAAFPGSRHLDSDPQTIRDWNAGKIPLLLAHPASAGHGLSLQDGGNIIVYFTSWYALENHQQILERIGPVRQMQSGYDRPVYVHYIMSRGTVDELILEVVEGKANLQDAFIRAQAEFNRREAQPLELTA